MARRRAVDDEDDEDRPKKRRAREDDDDEDEARPKKPSMNNAYTGLLGITFVALAAAAVIFYLDADELASQPVQAPSVTAPALGAAVAPAGTAAPMGN